MRITSSTVWAVIAAGSVLIASAAAAPYRAAAAPGGQGVKQITRRTAKSTPRPAAKPAPRPAVKSAPRRAAKKPDAPQRKAPVNKTAAKRAAAANRPPRRGPTPPPRRLEPVSFRVGSDGAVLLEAVPDFSFRFAGRVAGLGPNRELIFYSLNPSLQTAADDLIRRIQAPHAAIVAVEPGTGRILAFSQKSVSLPNAALHAGFPAASLFKLVTAAAALDRNRLGPFSRIRYRGGTYELSRSNYLPNPARDNREMSLADALGKSCNPVFGRVATEELDAATLRAYARFFGFNRGIDFALPLPPSRSHIPLDPFELARTGAGFGPVRISPVHAALIMAGIADDGILPRPILVDHILQPDGRLLFRSRIAPLQRMMRPATARMLMNMMQHTTTTGTSRREFMPHGRPAIPGLAVAAKTGTLSGSDPEGLNRWFVAAAPIGNPKLALAVIVVNPRGPTSRPSYIGRAIFQKFFGG